MFISGSANTKNVFYCLKHGLMQIKLTLSETVTYEGNSRIREAVTKIEHSNFIVILSATSAHGRVKTLSKILMNQ